MTPLEKIIFLNRVPLFQSLALEDIDLVAAAIREESREDGETLFREGEAGDSLYIIAQGQIEIFQARPEGQCKLATLNESDFLGEMALFENENRSATAICVGYTTLLVLNKSDLTQLIYQYPSIAFGIIQALCSRLRHSASPAPPHQSEAE